MLFIGDVHGGIRGKLSNYRTIAERYDGETRQVGDFGMGFMSVQTTDEINRWFEVNPQHKFIRGNHDSPQLCKQSPGWLRDGCFDVARSIFYVGGAKSKDANRRHSGIDHWDDEEVSSQEFDSIIQKYAIVKPRIVVTHDLPQAISTVLFRARSYMEKTRTRQALQIMLELHAPEIWLTGHWHESAGYRDKNTTFRVLNELETFEVEV